MSDLVSNSKERRKTVCDSTMLRRIFGPKQDEVRGSWVKLRIGEPRCVYFSLNITTTIHEDGMGGACGTHDGEDECLQSVGKRK
jgi:hypothetical protein